MALFGRGKKKPTRILAPIDPKWARSPVGNFFTLLDLDPDQLKLSGQGGVYVIWHGGVKSKWVFVDDTDNLASALVNAMDNEDITQFQVNGGLFVAWAPIAENFRKGVVLFLTQTMKPIIENPNAPKSESDTLFAVPVFGPGSEPGVKENEEKA